MSYLPRRISYVCSSKETIEVFDSSDNEDKLIAEYKVYPAFPVEDGRPLEGAIKWTGLKNPIIETFDRDHIESVRVCDLDYRGNGGRAYKVIINDKYYVDMREDVILDTMITCGIEKGALLKGKYVWAKYGSNTKLVRVGSSAYEEYANGEIPMEMVEIPKSEIKIGGIYEMKSGTRLMYLGKFETYKYEHKEHHGYFRNLNEMYYDQCFNKTKVFLFAEVNKWNFPNPETANPLRMLKQEPYYIEMKASMPKFFKKIAEHDLSKVDVIDKIKDNILKKVQTDKNPYVHNQYPNILNLGEKATLHPIFESYNYPING